MNNFLISLIAVTGLTVMITVPADAHEVVAARTAEIGPGWIHYQETQRFRHADRRYDRDRRDWHGYRSHHHKRWRRLARAHDRWHRRNAHRWDRYYRRDHARLHRELGLHHRDFHYRAQ